MTPAQAAALAERASAGDREAVEALRAAAARTGGRPRKPVDMARVRELRAQRKGDKEIAAELGVSVSTVRRREEEA